MKSYIKYIIIAIISLTVGLLLGVWIFGNTQSSTAGSQSHDQHETGTPFTMAEEIWTCSMHPQIRQNEPGDCPICGMDLIPLEEGSSNDPLILQMTDEAVRLAQIQTTQVSSTDGPNRKSIRLSGKIQADERLASSQVAHIPGRIEKLFVSFTGEKVSKGQKIATLYSPELITAQRELLEAQKLEELNSDLLVAARNKLRYWKINEETIRQIEESKVIQESFPVYADESGIVMQKHVAVGDYIKLGEPLFDLVSLRRVWALFDAYEEDLAHIAIGDYVQFTTPTYSNKTFESRITFIDPVINARTRVAQVRTEINNSQGLLKPEMLIYGLLQSKSGRSQQLTIPKSAVLWTGQRSVVYVKKADASIPSFEYREVEIGESLGNSYELINGLEADEEVVTHGAFTIDAAAQLNNQSSMMNQNVTIKKMNQTDQVPNFKGITPEDFQDQLYSLTEAYFKLKDALVATDAEKSKEFADDMVSLLEKVDMTLIEGDAQIYWMELQKAIKSHGERIQSSDDMAIQRKEFDFLSQALIKSVKAFRIGDSTVYVQHCPMADNNKGADWLSQEKAIRNPYFGDQMLKCGLIKTTIDKTFESHSLTAEKE